MFIPGGAGLAGAKSFAPNHFGSTRPSVPGRHLCQKSPKRNLQFSIWTWFKQPFHFR